MPDPKRQKRIPTTLPYKYLIYSRYCDDRRTESEGTFSTPEEAESDAVAKGYRNSPFYFIVVDAKESILYPPYDKYREDATEKEIFFMDMIRALFKWDKDSQVYQMHIDIAEHAYRQGQKNMRDRILEKLRPAEKWSDRREDIIEITEDIRALPLAGEEGANDA